MNWTEQLFELVLIPLLIAVSGYVIAWLKAKKEELTQKTKNELTKKYLDMLETTIAECVAATNQTYVSALKQAGSFDAEAQKNAFNLTYEAVVSMLTEEAHKYLSEAIKDVNSYITNKIEATVNMSK